MVKIREVLWIKYFFYPSYVYSTCYYIFTITAIIMDKICGESFSPASPINCLAGSPYPTPGVSAALST
jgi:hypothetical protein